MTKEEIEQRAVYKGHPLTYKLVHRFNEYPSYEWVPNKDITYYFDADMVEIGYQVAFNGAIDIHTEGRVWHESFLNGLQIEKLKKGDA